MKIELDEKTIDNIVDYAINNPLKNKDVNQIIRGRDIICFKGKKDNR